VGREEQHLCLAKAETCRRTGKYLVRTRMGCEEGWAVRLRVDRECFTDIPNPMHI
jgi:hypothetical protein